jgi:hypothetical protein
MPKEKQTGGALRRRLVTALALMRRQADAHADEARRAPEDDLKKRAAHAGAAFAMLHARELLKRAMR